MNTKEEEVTTEDNIVKKPDPDDYPYKPYGYIHALQLYIEYLENKINSK